jgi:RecG-like helicase
MKEAIMRKMNIALMVTLAMTSILFAQEIEITGEVTRVEDMTSPESDVNIVQAQIQTRNREMIMAHLGPAWIMDRDLEIGDEVTVRGKYDEENRFMVRELVCNNVRYRVRGEDYEPLWMRTRLHAQNQIYNPQTEKQVKGQITQLHMDRSSSMMEAMLESQNGEMIRVRLAPEWYLRNQLRVGDRLELRGSAVTDDEGMFVMAREMRNMRTNLEIALRNRQGFPDWCGKGKCAEEQQGKPCCNDEHVGRGHGHRN